MVSWPVLSDQKKIPHSTLPSTHTLRLIINTEDTDQGDNDSDQYQNHSSFRPSTHILCLIIINTEDTDEGDEDSDQYQNYSSYRPSTNILRLLIIINTEDTDEGDEDSDQYYCRNIAAIDPPPIFSA